MLKIFIFFFATPFPVKFIITGETIKTKSVNDELWEVCSWINGTPFRHHFCHFRCIPSSHTYFRKRFRSVWVGGHKTFLQSILERHGNDGDDAAADVQCEYEINDAEKFISRSSPTVVVDPGNIPDWQPKTNDQLGWGPNQTRELTSYIHSRFRVHLDDNILTERPPPPPPPAAPPHPSHPVLHLQIEIGKGVNVGVDATGNFQ